MEIHYVFADEVIQFIGKYTARTGESFPIKTKSGVTIRGRERLTSHSRGAVIQGGRTIKIDSAGRTRYVTIFAADGAILRDLIIDTTNSAVTTVDPVTGVEGAVDDGVGILCDRGRAIIENNIFRGVGHAGVTVLQTANPRVANNQFIIVGALPAPEAAKGSPALSWGITLHGSGRPEVTGNTFTCMSGIDITQTSRAIVRENTIQSEFMGIRIQNESSPTIENNVVSGHQSQGIFINDGPTPLIAGNTFENNGSGRVMDGGVTIMHTARPDLGGGARGSRGRNTFRNNNEYDLYNRSSAEIFAEGNTWTHRAAADIDREDIYDDDEEARAGRVRF